MRDTTFSIQIQQSRYSLYNFVEQQRSVMKKVANFWPIEICLSHQDHTILITKPFSHESLGLEAWAILCHDRSSPASICQSKQLSQLLTTEHFVCFTFDFCISVICVVMYVLYH
jgi:hypothetical protein